MDNLLTEKAAQAGRVACRNTLSFTLLTTTLLLSSGAFANRPAMDEPNSESTNNTVVESTSETRPEALPETQQTAPSSVELMMQQQTPQTYQTGDVVQLPATEMQPGETLIIQVLDSPRRGMNMDKVQFTYGEPITISESVGSPPITRWIYNDRVVYFEYATVLHVVAR